MATTTEPRTAEIARDYFEAIGRHDLEAMVAMWKPDGHGYVHGMVEVRIPDSYREWFGNLFRAFPDFEITVLDLVAEGEKAAVRWRAVGTFDGDTSFLGMAPNGARVESEGLDLLTIREGLIETNFAYTNGAETARQLGALPAQGSLQERVMLGAVNLRSRARGLLRR